MGDVSESMQRMTRQPHCRRTTLNNNRLNGVNLSARPPVGKEPKHRLNDSLRGYTSVNAENLGDFREFLEEKYSIKCFGKLRTYLAIFDLYYIIFFIEKY